jgi:hypothetical protein
MPIVKTSQFWILGDVQNTTTHLPLLVARKFFPFREWEEAPPLQTQKMVIAKVI